MRKTKEGQERKAEEDWKRETGEGGKEKGERERGSGEAERQERMERER